MSEISNFGLYKASCESLDFASQVSPVYQTPGGTEAMVATTHLLWPECEISPMLPCALLWMVLFWGLWNP